MYKSNGCYVQYKDGCYHASPKARARLEELGIKRTDKLVEEIVLPQEYAGQFMFYNDGNSIGELYTESEVREEKLDVPFNRIQKKACDFFGLDVSSGEYVDSGCELTDGGSCIGHWYDYDYKVAGTAGNMEKKRTLTFGINDGYVMDGNRTGPLREDPEWSCNGLPSDFSRYTLSEAAALGLDGCSAAVFFHYPGRMAGSDGYYEGGIIVFDKKDQEGKWYVLYYGTDDTDLRISRMGTNELCGLYRDYIEPKDANDRRLFENKVGHLLYFAGISESKLDMSFVRDVVSAKAEYYGRMAEKEPVDFLKARYEEKSAYWKKVSIGEPPSVKEDARCRFCHDPTASDTYETYRHVLKSNLAGKDMNIIRKLMDEYAGYACIEFEDEMRAGVEPGRSVDSSGIDY